MGEKMDVYFIKNIAEAALSMAKPVKHDDGLEKWYRDASRIGCSAWMAEDEDSRLAAAMIYDIRYDELKLYLRYSGHIVSKEIESHHWCRPMPEFSERFLKPMIEMHATSIAIQKESA